LAVGIRLDEHASLTRSTRWVGVIEAYIETEIPISLGPVVHNLGAISSTFVINANYKGAEIISNYIIHCAPEEPVIGLCVAFNGAVFLIGVEAC